jgi:hypothetical protein
MKSDGYHSGMGRKPKAKSERVETKVISFRVNVKVYQRLEAYARTLVDEAESPLTVSRAARKAMLKGLDRLAGPDRSREK